MAGQPAQLLEVSRSSFMVHGACGHEQRGFENGVIDDVEDCGDASERTAQPQEKGYEAQVADGLIGQDGFHVALEHRQIGSQRQRDQTDGSDEPEP